MTAPEHPRLVRYEDLFSYVFPQAGRDGSEGESTAQYSGTVLPPEGAHLGRSDPDRSAEKFCERALAGLRQFFTAHSMLDQPLPPSISDQIHRVATRQFARATITTEADVRTITVLLLTIVQDILFELAMGLDLQWPSSRETWFQHGDLDVVTSSSESGTPITQFALEEKKPSVLKEHRRAICDNSYTFQRQKYPGGAKSILFKLYLHMNSRTPAAETGVITDGFCVIFVEHYLHEGRHGFLTSPSYEIFQVQHGGIVVQGQRAPIIALLLSLAIPGVIIERPSLPAEPVSIAVQDEPLTPPPPATLVLPPSAADSKTGSPTPDNIPEAVYLVVDNRVSASNTLNNPSLVAMSGPLSSSTATSTLPTAARSSSDSLMSADVLLASTLLHRGPGAKTWLVCHGDGGRQYIAKVFNNQDGSWDQAVREQSAIQAVRARCGDITPSALGLYRWQEDEGGLLLQEHGGLKLAETFRELPQADRDAVWAIATNLHANGIHHGDIYPANFVRGPDGVIRVLDFGQADLQHQCPGPDRCYELQCLNCDLSPV